MIYAYILVPLLALLLGSIGGYFVGRYQSQLMNKIRTLEGQTREVKTKPTITMGAYSHPKEMSNVPDKSKVGIVEAKTPELVEWENEQLIEKQALGR
jgi:uncharacterized protein YneF (UPF0154 family)